MNNTVTTERNAVAAAGLTAVMWGLAGIFVWLLPPVSPLAVTTGRLLVALIVALPIPAVFRH
jgi:EamA domain-containing membrane protein RarD